MTIASIHRFAGTTLSEGDASIRRVPWHPYQGPQNAEPAAPAEAGIRESQSPVLWEPSLGERASIAAELSVTAICAGCGTSFVPKRSDARFCSGRCRVAAHRKTAA
jgi:hypothetical protein